MNITSQRFGVLEVEEDQVLQFPQGVIGFPHEREFVMVPHNSTGFLAWLQSATSPALALPVVSAHAFGAKYPDVDIEQAIASAELGGTPEEVALMVVLCAPQGQPATVNLLAPIIVNAATRRGAQVILEGSRFTTRELFIREPEAEAQKAPAAAE
ncbi:MAG: flagellar assembly protein FliW [Myxococcota bacterium]